MKKTSKVIAFLIICTLCTSVFPVGVYAGRLPDPKGLSNSQKYKILRDVYRDHSQDAAKTLTR